MVAQNLKSLRTPARDARYFPPLSTASNNFVERRDSRNKTIESRGHEYFSATLQPLRSRSTAAIFCRHIIAITRTETVGPVTGTGRTSPDCPEAGQDCTSLAIFVRGVAVVGVSPRKISTPIFEPPSRRRTGKAKGLKGCWRILHGLNSSHFIPDNNKLINVPLAGRICKPLQPLSANVFASTPERSHR